MKTETRPPSIKIKEKADERNTHYDIVVSQADKEDNVGVGSVTEQLQESMGRGRDPGAGGTTVYDSGRERDELGTGGGNRRVVEEARELDIPSVFTGAGELLRRLFTCYQCQRSRHFLALGPLEFGKKRTYFKLWDRGFI